MKRSATDALTIGDCRIFPGTGEVERANRRIQLEPKVMALLLYLVEHAGATVTREQLFAAVWPDVIVTDDTLTQAIIKLRKALGDDARNPRYIKTLPKRGYQLSAKVSEISARDDARFRLPPPGVTGFLASLLVLLLIVLFLVQPLEPGDDPAMVPTTDLANVAIETLPTLTVEPFVLLGEDRSQLYLAQGITHDLVTDLSRLRGLWVIGSRSILGQTGEQSGAGTVNYRVNGEIQRARDRLRINVHLVDTERGRQIWSQRYHVSMDQLFRVQEQMTRQIATMLSLKVSEEEHRRIAYRYTHNIRAYELFLQAQSLLLVRQKSENDQARRLYRQAIELDPSFARAYAGLALSLAAEYRNQWVKEGAASLEQARSMARTALQIDPEIPEVYWVLAYINTQQRNHERAMRLLKKAVSLDQSFADAYALMGGVSTYMGHADRSPGLIRMAIRLNPEAGYLYYLLLGRAYFYLQEWELAQINLSEALSRNPASLEAHVYLAAVLEASGKHDEAEWQAEEVNLLESGFEARNWLRTYPMTDQAQRDQLVGVLARLGLAH